ncbi:MAG TPA: HAMP domain-containing sensor histidine kinase [Bacillota bacterium]|nr:HAMP domain-containing sensor histidine kinase [Bacillota bacterium]
MRENRMKFRIYTRTFFALFAVYLVLMAGFSAFLILQEKKVSGLQFGTYASYTNSEVGEILRDYVDADHQITDIRQIKKELVQKSFNDGSGTELAVYTGDYGLIYHTSDNWICSYTERSEGDTQYVAYGEMDPREWFDEKTVKEIESYVYADPKPKKIGDLAWYSLSIEGLWVDNGMIIPDRISVTPIYAQNFDEGGNVVSGSGSPDRDLVYVSGYENVKELPYYKYGGLTPRYGREPGSEIQQALRTMVTDREKLEATVRKAPLLSSREMVNLVICRYYLVMPYQNMIDGNDEENPYSTAWTVMAREVNLLDRCAGTMAYVWGSCLVVFFIAALILSMQTYKTYRKREEMESRRKELTSALAHDLKTPLSIISGYAQNLMENINEEKRGQYAGGIQTNVERMDKIIREMLELSKLESDKLQIKYEDVSLGEVCAGLTARYREVCAERSLTVRLEGDGAVKAERSLMERVLDNFYVNALDHTPYGGTIRIRIAEDTLEFYNSGSHIPEEKLEEIWEPFKKADASRSNTKGTGLGLAIARAILELYRFPCGARNEDDGVIFWFKLSERK